MERMIICSKNGLFFPIKHKSHLNTIFDFAVISVTLPLLLTICI